MSDHLRRLAIYHRPSWSISTVVLLLVVDIILPPVPCALADEGIRVFVVRQQDIDQDGHPGLKTIDCRFASSTNQTRVFYSGDDMGQPKKWENASGSKNDTGLSVHPSTPISLSVGDLQVGARGKPIKDLAWTTLSVEVVNEGVGDAWNVPVCAVLRGPEERKDVLTTTASLVPGGAKKRIVWDWLPHATGLWQAQIGLGCDSGRAEPALQQVLLVIDFRVKPQPTVSPFWLLSLGGRVRAETTALLVSTALLASSAVIMWFLQDTFST